MQATVKTFEPATRSGTVLLDDGTELGFGAVAFDASGLRMLRPGQRVRLRVDHTETLEVTALTLGTMPFRDEAT